MANFNFNKVILGGRLTSDPELKATQSGTNVCSFTIAVNRRGSKDGQQQSDFITCVAWKERAELVTKFFRKGSSICIVGELQTRKWQDSNGNNRSATEVIVNEVCFVDSKGEGTNTDYYPKTAKTTYVPDVYKTEPKPSFEEIGNDSDLPF